MTKIFKFECGIHYFTFELRKMSSDMSEASTESGVKEMENSNKRMEGSLSYSEA